MEQWYFENHTNDVKFSIKIKDHILTRYSKFQRIDFYRSETFGTFFTLDGLMMVNEKDEFAYHDMIVHPAFAVNPFIRNVLIIGGGDGGTAREVSRYPNVEKIHMVEIDELVVRLCEEYLPVTASALSSDKRIDLFFEDGVNFVKKSSEGSYDLILVDSTDPIGPGEGLFSTSFYNDCYRILSDNGILVNQHESPYYTGYAKEMARSHKKIKDVFPIAKVYDFHMPTYPSGHWLFGFASKTFDPLKDFKPGQWKEFGINARYYNTDLHEASFCLPQYVKEILDNV